MNALIENFINISILIRSISDLLEAYRIFADVFRINKAFSLCKVVADDDFCLIILVCK